MSLPVECNKLFLLFFCFGGKVAEDFKSLEMLKFRKPAP